MNRWSRDEWAAVAALLICGAVVVAVAFAVAALDAKTYVAVEDYTAFDSPITDR